MGNHRGDLAALQEPLGDERWQNNLNFAEQAALSIPNAHCVGLNILISTNKKPPYVIEANAFGDLLLHASVNGLDPYQTEVNWLTKTNDLHTQ